MSEQDKDVEFYDPLDDFFSKVDEAVKLYDRKRFPLKHKSPNALKRYRPPNDNPILKFPAKPLKIVLHWTEIHCQCGQIYRTPTYPGASAFVHWPHHTKQGVIDILPLRRYQVIHDDLPLEEETKIHNVDICHSCFTGCRKQLQLFQNVTSSVEVKRLEYKPQPSEDIRDYLDDPELLAHEDDLNDLTPTEE